jgi:hypothetical protein
VKVKRKWATERAASALAGALALAGGAASAEDATAPGCTVKLVKVDAQNVPAFRGECVWSVAPAWVAAVLTDPARLDASSSMLEKSERLPDGRIVNVQKTGWPFEDRQSTILVEDEPLPGGGVLRRYWLASDQAPLAKGAVQVAVDEGSWEVAPHPQGVRVVLQMAYAPGGNLPASLVQSMSPKYIARGLDELRVSAEKLARASGALPNVAAGPPK